VKYNLLIIRYGEIALKAKETRKRFENTLVINIKNALEFEQIQNKVTKDRGRIYVYSNQIDKCALTLQKIFGITSISPALQTNCDINSISDLSKSFSKEFITKQKSFALRVTRTGEHDYSSQEVAVKIGNDIVKMTGAKVNLNEPDFELFIEIRNKYAYIFTQKKRGTGGLPMDSQGKVLTLITNPKSILAAWYIMHRGCKTYFANVNRLYTKMLNSFITNWYTNSHIYNINENKKNYYKDIRRIAYEKNCDAIVTGHSLFNNNQNEFLEIKLLKKHIDLPILNPLIAMEMDKIKQKCKNIGISL
jgi:thiamine biosynthesis protein ThiI